MELYTFGWQQKTSKSITRCLASDVVSLDGERSPGVGRSLGKRGLYGEADCLGSHTGPDAVDRNACELSSHSIRSENHAWDQSELGKDRGHRERSRTTCPNLVEPTTG